MLGYEGGIFYEGNVDELVVVLFGMMLIVCVELELGLGLVVVVFFCL